MVPHKVQCSLIYLWQPPVEEVKKEITDRDVREGFDITLTKHKGQVQVISPNASLDMINFYVGDISSKLIFLFWDFLCELIQRLLFFFFLQYALRKLYHESPRLICVLYTAPTCGPCRTLKPILSKVHYFKFVLLLHVI